MNTFYGDLETYCEIPITHGSYRYAEEAEIMIWSWALDDGPEHSIDLTLPFDMIELDMIELKYIIQHCDEAVFHYSVFDRAVLNAKAPDYCPPLHKWRDTMVQALAHSLPGALAKLCTVLDVPADQAKMAAGKKLINLFCKPRPKNSILRRATRLTHPVEWAQFLDYGLHDITAMRYVHKMLPTWNYPSQMLDLWHLDQRINDRGILVDMDMVDSASRIVEREKKRLAKHTAALTADEVSSTTQRDKLLTYILREYDVDLPDLKGDTIQRRLDDFDLPGPVRELLNYRLEASRASLAKYKAIKRSVSKDGRVRGTTQFCGAMRTARWSGRIIQPHNFMRTPEYLANEAAEEARDAIKAETMDIVYEKPMEVLSAAVPWTIVAPPGRKIVVADLSNIEARGGSWLAGEQWKLDMYRHFDEDKKDLTRDPYILGYARSFNEPIEDVIKDYLANGVKRQIGKIQELFLMYEGGVGAYVTGAVTYHIDLDALGPRAATLPKDLYDHGATAWRRALEENNTYDLDRQVYIVLDAFVQQWRASSPATKQFWYNLQAACRQAIREPGLLYTVGRLRIRRQGEWLGIKLPSGHTLCYPNPEVIKGKITYQGINQYSRKWTTIETHGGKIMQNCCEGISTGAGGILGFAMPHVEEAGYEIITHSHDELATEAPDTDEYGPEDLADIFCKNPWWADGWPLTAGGYETPFYRKD